MNFFYLRLQWWLLAICLVPLAHTISQTVKADTVAGRFIHVDQFGYHPQAAKVAVLSDPQTGFDAALAYTPGSQLELREMTSGKLVFRSKPVAWRNGLTDSTSGNRCWWFDFSAVTKPGTYYVSDPQTGERSYAFRIDDAVYRDVLKAAMRMFYYNRCGHEKLAVHAGDNWADGPSFVGPRQDTEARSLYDSTNAATALDLSGGWWDAGDYNKYVTFAVQPVHQLLSAWQQYPDIFTDDYNIPESGNGLPDLIDELKWETDWLCKMQLPDGSAIVKMGCLVNTDQLATLPPSTDRRYRYYYPGGCSSGTISLSGMLAHAALVYQGFDALKPYAENLQQRAINAWTHYHANPRRDNCDDGTIQAGDADRSLRDQDLLRIEAAVYLFALTGNAAYRDTVDAHFRQFEAFRNGYWATNEREIESLLYYAQLKNATPAVARAITNLKTTVAANLPVYGWRNSDGDPYRSFVEPWMYHWGSLNTRAMVGTINNDLVVYGLDATNNPAYRQRAEETLHYFHGVNPLSLVYLTNMGGYGAENSATEVYHSWFKDGSDWDHTGSRKGGPAPGYVPGGPNATYKNGEGKCLLMPPCAQPRQKAYANWNGIWPDASWEVTEPAIYYQAAYVKLLAAVMGNAQKAKAKP